jgi:hypothetical protein
MNKIILHPLRHPHAQIEDENEDDDEKDLRYETDPAHRG